MSPEIISTIVKTCRRNNVQSITLDGLTINFFEHDYNVVKPKKLNRDQEEKLKADTNAENIRQREMQLALMDLEDPVAYEQIVLSGSEKEFIDASENDQRT